MRRFYKSTEYWTTWIAFLLATFISFGIGVEAQAIAITTLCVSYMFSRVLWKKNRGQFYTGLFTSELQMLIFSHTSTMIIFIRYGDELPAKTALILIVIGQVAYNIGRGLTKGIGVKTQTIFK